MRVSLYADDAVIFANPVKDKVDTLMEILQLFGDATGLKLNQEKCTVAPIRCSDINLTDVLQNFRGTTVGFPMTYLGLPISTVRLRVVHLQFILDRIRARLAGWKGRLMNLAGHRVLVRCVLTALPTFTLTVLHAPKKILKEADKARRCFLWAQDDELTGGKCKVGWQKVCSPIDKGGLGLHDLRRFSRARLRWLWLEWQHPQRPWNGFPVSCDEADRLLFASATTVTSATAAQPGSGHVHGLALNLFAPHTQSSSSMPTERTDRL